MVARVRVAVDETNWRGHVFFAELAKNENAECVESLEDGVPKNNAPACQIDVFKYQF